MDMQKILNNQLTADRKKRLDTSDQLTLGEIILKLIPIVEQQKSLIEEGKEEAQVVYDFEYLYPTKIDSWRGSYAELALNFEMLEYDSKRLKASEFLKLLQDTVGRTFTGYKGGEFLMSKNTPVWVANYGHSGNTAVVDIIDEECEVVIITGRREF